jgi:hypothetical protein
VRSLGEQQATTGFDSSSLTFGILRSRYVALEIPDDDNKGDTYDEQSPISFWPHADKLTRERHSAGGDCRSSIEHDGGEQFDDDDDESA